MVTLMAGEHGGHSLHSRKNSLTRIRTKKTSPTLSKAFGQGLGSPPEGWPMKAPATSLVDFSMLLSRMESFDSRLQALERSCGPRDAADVALLHAMFDAFGSTPFRPSAVFRFAGLEPGVAERDAVRDALLEADVDNPHQLGQLLSRLSKRDDVAGMCVRKHRRPRHWVVISDM